MIKQVPGGTLQVQIYQILTAFKHQSYTRSVDMVFKQSYGQVLLFAGNLKFVGPDILNIKN